MHALYAAIPPVTPRSTRRPPRAERSVVTRASFGPDRSGPGSIGYLMPTPSGRSALILPSAISSSAIDRGLFRKPGLDQRRHELGAALAELVVVGVDLASALGRQRHERVLGVDLSEQVVDLGLDHGFEDPFSARPVPRPGDRVASGRPSTCGDASMIAATSSAARSASSFTITTSNHRAASSSRSAFASRRPDPPRSRCLWNAADARARDRRRLEQDQHRPGHRLADVPGARSRPARGGRRSRPRAPGGPARPASPSGARRSPAHSSSSPASIIRSKASSDTNR